MELLLAVSFGLCLGSFLNVVIYRLPRGLSIVRPQSFCPHCKRQIPWYENIPVLSFVLLKGHCRGCGTRISLRYPTVELTSGALAFWLVGKYGFSPQSFLFLGFLLILLASSLIDLEHRVIPDELSLGGMLAGLTLSPINPLVTLETAFLGALCGAGSLYLLGEFYCWFRKREGIGGGDCKLLAMMGSFLGPQKLIPVILWASLAGITTVLILSLARKKTVSGTTDLAFGPCLAMGAFLVLATS